jgi:O-antigen/teichoic acid export membrane protein
VVLVFGDEYRQSGDLLRWISLLIVLGSIKAPFVRLMITMGRERLLLSIQMLSILLNVALNLALIPLFGIVGAAAASAASEFLLASWLFVICRRLVPADYARQGALVLIAAAVTAGVSIPISHLLHWSALLVLCVFTFLSCGALIGLLRFSDLAILRFLIFGRSR